MSDLFVIAYDNLKTANEVRDKVFELQRERAIELQDAVVVERKKDGKIKLHQSSHVIGGAAAGGALWGGLIGLIFLMPLLGMAIGGAAGAAAGAAADYGVDSSFMRELGEYMQPGTAALFLLVGRSTPDKVIPGVAKYGGRLIRTSLSSEQEEHLREAARAAQPA
ncbi:MAG TPA: DUF1269 domain-containing protein [Streptosporangiaceae bacterium]|nr:DUF1269 domain-containing protein [Streptosporangiaceae bacterium]